MSRTITISLPVADMEASKTLLCGAGLRQQSTVHGRFRSFVCIE